ncbi:MAG: glycosyltransferase [Lachnospiraceae bacterium]|nr:glycosyltransferase [Lachnospiraceae bacterium]
MGIDITIIVPVYKVEQYIRANAESLIALKNPNIEILYIDDGSPDQSVAILEEYQKTDNRIRIIRQQHHGASVARNRGISEARGKWILFVDGDDWIDPTLTEELICEANDENDIVWGTYEEVDCTGKVEWQQEVFPCLRGVTRDGITWMREGKVACMPWLYLFRTQLLRNSGVIFPEGFLHEDEEFIPEVFYYAKKVKYTGIPFYKYVIRPGSAMRTADVNRARDLIRIAEHIERFAKEKVNHIEYKEFLKTERGRICAQALHAAILDDISLQFVFKDNEELRSIAIRYLVNSSRKRDKMAGMLLMFRMWGLYAKMYRWYSNRRNRKQKRKISV